MCLISTPKDSKFLGSLWIKILIYTTTHFIVCDNIPFGQFVHVKCNRTKVSGFTQDAGMLHISFLSQGYPLNIIKQACFNVDHVAQSELLKYTLKQGNDNRFT